MINVTWTAPTKHTSGRPVQAGELTGYELFMKVEGAPDFTSIATPAATDVSFSADVTDPGLYSFQLVAKSSNGKVSAPATGSVQVPDTTALEAPQNFSVSLV